MQVFPASSKPIPTLRSADFPQGQALDSTAEPAYGAQSRHRRRLVRQWVVCLYAETIRDFCVEKRKRMPGAQLPHLLVAQ